ncbi:MAG: hypothetical protein QOJ19_3768 [Acidimicrobiia bacterium]|nr:hypothetical protein [Acidimicrobiia bacterium]
MPSFSWSRRNSGNCSRSGHVVGSSRGHPGGLSARRKRSWSNRRRHCRPAIQPGGPGVEAARRCRRIAEPRRRDAQNARVHLARWIRWPAPPAVSAVAGLAEREVPGVAWTSRAAHSATMVTPACSNRGNATPITSEFRRTAAVEERGLYGQTASAGCGCGPFASGREASRSTRNRYRLRNRHGRVSRTSRNYGRGTRCAGRDCWRAGRLCGHCCCHVHSR